MLEDKDFDDKKMIIIVGKYYKGKKKFIKYLLEKDLKGIRIGKEKKKDRFIKVMYEEKEGVIKGNELVVDKKRKLRKM